MPASYDDKGMQDALKQYLDIKKNVDPKKEIRRRAKNVGMRLINLNKQDAPSEQKILSKAAALGTRLKIRKRFKKPGVPLATQFKKEVKARVNARQFTATGWHPAVEALGGSPKAAGRIQGPKRGRLIEKLGALSSSETLVNEQPGAEHTAMLSGNAMQKALDAERDDILKYVNKKLEQAAKQAGL